MGGELSISAVRRFVGAVFGAAVVSVAIAAAPPESRAASQASWMFDNDRVVEIDFSGVTPAEIEALEAEPDEYVSAGFELAVDGVPQGPELGEVGLRLKGGTGSFREIGLKAGFKVKFDEYVDDQRFFALERLTLNNMVQDPSMLHEGLTYELVEEMGLKGPRTGYAFVRLDGEVYGVYANVETMDEHWLPEHFATTQHLYEADAPGTDVVPGGAGVFEVDQGDDEDLSDLEALIAAADGGGDWSDGMAAVADLSQMTRLWAVERYVSHWDGYAGELDDFRPNNYYLHSDAGGVFTMLPWGTDQTWGTSSTIDARVEFDEDAGGLLFNECKADAGCWVLYESALEDVYEVVTGDGAEFGRKASERADLLAACQALELPERREYDAEEIADGVSEVLDYVAERPAELADYLGVGFAGVDEDAPGSLGEEDCRPSPPRAPDQPSAPPAAAPSPPLAETPRARFGRSALQGATIATRLRLTGPGRVAKRVTAVLDGRGRQICSAAVERDAAGAVTLRCSLSEAAREKLRDGPLKVRIRLAFFPLGGERTLKVRSLTLPRA